MSKIVEKLAKNISLSETVGVAKDNAKEVLTFEDVQKERLQILKDIHATKSLTDILAAEKLLLATEAVKSKVQEDSIEVAVAEFNAELKSLSIIQNKEKYQDANETYFGKTRDSEGLPKDSFRNFITSHKTRLRNKLSNPESEIQTKIFEQRRKNLTLANELYIEKQREVLRPIPREELARKEKANDMRNLSIEEFRKKHPDSAEEEAIIKYYEANLSSIANVNFRAQMMEKCKADLANIIERGEKLPDILPDILPNTSVKP